jgi:hypothetical protein
MVFLCPPPEYFTHISENLQDAERVFFNPGNNYCKFVECIDTSTNYYTLPDPQDILSKHMGYNPPEKNGQPITTHSKNEYLKRVIGMLILWIPKALRFCILGVQKAL